MEGQRVYGAEYSQDCGNKQIGGRSCSAYTSHHLCQVSILHYIGRMEPGGEGDYYYTGSVFDSPPTQSPSECVQVYLALSFWSLGP